MIEPIGYKLNPNKLKGAPQSILPYVVGAFYYTEDFEYFDVIKPYLDIPEPPKSLEEIQKELDEKIDKRIERVKEQFNKLGYTQEYQYQVKFNRIFENFEYARKNGRPREKFTLVMSNDSLSVNTYISSNFVIKEGGEEVGYYTFGSGYLRYCMNKKPNFIVRFCMNKLLGFKWISTK
jgi:hypothetical protein